MAINNENVGFSSIDELSDVIVTQFQTRFAEAINKADQFGQKLSREVVTDTEGAQVPFINSWSQLNEYEINESPSYSTIIGNYISRKIKKFARGIEISKISWNNPASQSILLTQLDALVAEAAWLRTRRVANILNLGNSAAYKTYDDKNLFANDHELNGVTFDNLLSLSLTPDNFNTSKSLLQQVPLGEDGSYLPTEGATFHLMVHPQDEAQARLILRSGTIYEDYKTADNPYRDAATMHVSSLLTTQGTWYLAFELPGLTPFLSVRHITSTPELIPRIAETDPNVIERNMYLWNLQMLEETYPVHFYQVVKCIGSS